MQTEHNSSAGTPYPSWTFLARTVWLVVQATAWRLVWKQVPGLRGGILRIFGASMPLSGLISEGVRVYFPWMLRVGRHSAIGPRVDFYCLSVQDDA